MNTTTRTDAYTLAMQEGAHSVIPLVLGVGQVASMQEAAANIGVKLAIVPPFVNREKLFSLINGADVVLLDGALDTRCLPAASLVKCLMDGHLFGEPLEKPVTVFIRTTKPEYFVGFTELS